MIRAHHLHRNGSSSMNLKFYPYKKSEALDPARFDGELIGHLLDGSMPWYTVYRHSDGMLICWSYDNGDGSHRVVTNTRHVNELANYLPNIDRIVA